MIGNLIKFDDFQEFNLLGFAIDFSSIIIEICGDNSERNLRSTDLNLKIPLLNTKTGQKSFCYRGATLLELPG